MLKKPICRTDDNMKGLNSEGILRAKMTACPPFAVVHLPHSSAMVPEDVRVEIVLSDAELERELLEMTDWYTDELFALAGSEALMVCHPVSRLVVDPERFVDETQEPMASRGMGVVYSRTSRGELLRHNLTPTERAALIERYYMPHHARLQEAVDAALAQWGGCIVVDCHSFPSRPLPYEEDQQEVRPQICIGTDSYHTPAWLAETATKLFQSAGFSVALNQPFAGALVPAAYHVCDPRVLAVMIELNRGLYMDEMTGERLPGFSTLASQLGGLLINLIEEAGTRHALRE